MENKIVRASKRQKRIRAKITGSEKMPRLSVHRTNVYIYAQLIDDSKAATLIGVSEKELGKTSGTKIERAKALGTLLAKKAAEKKIKKVVFDKGEFRYHGRVKALADGAREGGLEF
ncbi:MAG TPA: 50S ribosomal protein L18 [Patescibacteria group bacterium]